MGEVVKQIFLAEALSLLSTQLTYDMSVNNFSVRIGVPSELLALKPKQGIELTEFNVQTGPYSPALLKNIETIIYSKFIGPDYLSRESQFLSAAVNAGVKKIIRIEEMNSHNVKNESHIETDAEKNIIKSGKLEWVFIRTNFFMQSLSGYGQSVKDKSCMYTVSAGKPVNFVDVTDVSRAICAIIKNNISSKRYIFTGVDPITYNQIAEMLSQTLGKKVINTDVGKDDLLAVLRNNGIPEDAISIMNDTFNFVMSGDAAIQTNDLQSLGIIPKRALDYFKQSIQLFS